MKQILFIKKLTVCIVALILYNTTMAKTIYYVTSTGTGDGSSWAKAANNIQTMIDKAISGDEVWVAKGTYYPTTETIARDARSRTFLLKSGVNLYGGFSGSETEISQRALTDINSDGKIEPCELSNTTLLSGDVDGVLDTWIKTTNSDGKTWTWTVTGNNGNCYRVVTESGSGLVIIDGFSVTGGNANKAVNSGGGICVGYSSTIINCIVSNCYADTDGGGIYTFTHNIINCIVFNCSAPNGLGGGIYTRSATNCTILNCSAKSGGGIYSISQAGASQGSSNSISNITNINVNNCSATIDGGGIYSYAYYYGTYGSDPTYPYARSNVSNCSVTNCTAGRNAGGIYSYSTNSSTTSSASSTASYVNKCFISNCFANFDGGGIYLNQSYSKIYNSNVYNTSNSLIVNCTATNNGGGVYATQNSKIINCSILNSFAGLKGGGIYINNANQELKTP